MTYGYDAENRLMTACKPSPCTSPTVNAAYQYDPLGRRTRKSGTGVTGTFYLSDGADEIAEYDGTAGTLTTRYIPGPAIDEPVAMVDGATGTKTYFHTNHQGSVIAMSGAGATLTEGPYTYDPYGNCFLGATQTPCSSSGEPYRFTGRRLDPETGCYYYRAREYCPAIGRFLQTDPVGYTADLNLYTYVGNDPTDKTDPSGMATCADPTCQTSTIDSNPAKNTQPPPVNGMEGINPRSQLGQNVMKGYDPGPTITFNNDDPKGASPNQPVTTDTAKMVESAVISSGASSVNVNSTTGGKHSTPLSRHYQKKAVDINRVNGRRVSDPSNRSAVNALQGAFGNEPNIRENFGPNGTTKTLTPGGHAVAWPGVQEDHEGHIHESGQD